jgi:hypothetical protein
VPGFFLPAPCSSGSAAGQQFFEKGPRRQGQHLAAQVHDAPRATQREPGDVEGDQTATLEAVAKRVARSRAKLAQEEGIRLRGIYKLS